MTSGNNRIVAFAGQDLAYELVEFLAARSDLDVFVVTERTRRDAVYGYRSGAEACRKTNTAFVEASSVDDALAQKIAEFRPRLILTAYYPHLLPATVIAMAEIGGANVHPGLLPHYRGRFPTPWYILNGESEYGVALHKLAEGADTGDVYVQRRYKLASNMTGHALYRQTMKDSLAIIRDHLDELLSGVMKAVPQQGFGSCYNSIEKRFEIDWNTQAALIERRIRVHARPYLPAFTYLFNRLLLINAATIVEASGQSAHGGGRIVEIDGQGRPIVTCTDGCLRLDEIEFAPRLETGDRETHLFAGARLG